MLGNQTIMAFVATANAEKARPFYENTLGLAVKSEDRFAIAFDANGILLRLTNVPDFKAAPYSVLSWVISDIDAMVNDLTAKGVIFEHYEGMGQDEKGVWTAPGGTKVAWFKDPDGNILSLTEFADGSYL